MNQHNDGFLRCVRHPSQFFTGFCSSCLVERLSNVGAVEHSEAPCSLQSEIVEITEVAPDSQGKPATEVRVRKTLQLLFELDDGHDTDNRELVASEQLVLVNSNACQYEGSASCCISSLDGACAEITTDIGTGISNIDVANVEINHSEDEKLYEGGGPARLSSMLSKKGWRWRTRSLSKKDEIQQTGPSSRGYDDKQSQSMRNLRHSCDWRVRQDLSRSLDPPRHSWDGSMVSKAFACSFNCLEEQQDETRRVKRSSPDEEMAGKSDKNDDNKVKINLAPMGNEKPSSTGSLGSLFRESSNDYSHSESNVPKIRRKKSQRWSKVWDWSITSPFRDFAKKRERALDRSLSESWRERRNMRSMENIGSDHSSQSNGGSVGSVRPNHYKQRNLNSSNGNLINFRPAWQNKREFKFGRSQSVHYSSPGNLDNGLLRFYLTPLRSSRRCTSKGRTKNSRSLARGLFGFY